jgi:hypothetical protein
MGKCITSTLFRIFNKYTINTKDMLGTVMIQNWKKKCTTEKAACAKPDWKV